MKELRDHSDAPGRGDVPAAAGAPVIAAAPDGALQLSGTLGIYQAAVLRNELLCLLERSPTAPIVDLSGLDRVDASVGQVLIAFKVRCPSARFIGLNEATREYFGLVGLGDLQ